jgi:hypothetical protein
VVTLLLAWLGARQYLENQQLEARKNFLTNQFQLYFKLVDDAITAVQLKDAKTRRDAFDDFERIYLGKLYLVENIEVEAASQRLYEEFIRSKKTSNTTVDESDQWDQSTYDPNGSEASKLRSLVYALNEACRGDLARSIVSPLHPATRGVSAP